MDEIVIRSMLKWPDVPDVYGWLQLDRRGNWRIRQGSSDVRLEFEPIGNTALREFIARNYAADGHGRWYFQNGPQRVFVTLAYTPFTFRLENGVLADQCGRVLRQPDEAWLDEEGSLILRGEDRVGLLDDRDLAAVEQTLADGMLMAGGTGIPVGTLASSEVESRFGFVRDPNPKG
jgi:hypothetical protein